jgi:hypothetical protein
MNNKVSRHCRANNLIFGDPKLSEAILLVPVVKTLTYEVSLIEVASAKSPGASYFR